ncbi:MAG: hypothetical protein MMC23_009814 [Stictis urceolatum]|nr:hypothetical protein [Stictis urceolata]
MAIEDAYKKAAKMGHTKAPPAEGDVDPHYVCLVESSGRLYELDGDMGGPTFRGDLVGSEDVLSANGLNVIRNYINSQPDGEFCLLAIVGS